MTVVGKGAKQRRRRPWWVGFQWSVEAETPAGWKEIYCTQKRAQAQSDADAWTERTGQATRIVEGIGHPSKREAVR